MALTDINLQEGEGMDFMLEIPAGTLGTPTDILLEEECTQFPVSEIPLVTGGGGGNIFIMSE